MIMTSPKWMIGACAALLALWAMMLVACSDREEPKKVSILARSPVSESQDRANVVDSSLKFGFDHRLSPKDDVRIYLSFIHYMSRQTGHKFSLRFTEKYEETADNLGRGLIQFAALGPVNYVAAKTKYGVDCLAMGLNQDGKPEYRGVIFVRPDSPIRHLEDLRGKSFAFGDRFSTQGHVIPRQMLEEAGVGLEALQSYVFTGSHANTAKAVLNGDYEAGAIQDVLADRLSREGRIKILAVSKPYPSSMICYAKGVDPATLATVKTALLEMDPKGDHRDLLVDWERTEMPSGFAEYQANSLQEIEELVGRFLSPAGQPQP
jgi:phosphonate transport system substrate-binding protein